MRIKNIIWPKTFEEARDLQEKWASQIVTKGKPTGVKLVAGVDMSHSRGSPYLYAAVVVLRVHNFEIVETSYAVMKSTFPYVPGYLSFREGPVLVKAIKQIKSSVDLWFFDGQGLAHPRKFGLACHMGLLLNTPALGVAKKKYVGEHKVVGQRAGNRTPLVLENKTIGEVLRTRNRVSPVYVSPGHLITIKEATTWAFRMVRNYRVPEPTRQAHIHVNRFRESQERAGA